MPAAFLAGCSREAIPSQLIAAACFALTIPALLACPAGIPRQARKTARMGAVAELKDDSARDRPLRYVGERAPEEQRLAAAAVAAGSQQIEGEAKG